MEFFFTILHIQIWLAFIVIACYAFGLVALSLIVVLGPPSEWTKKLKNIPVINIGITIGFLDMLCNGIIEMGTVNTEDPKWDLPNYDNMPTRNRAGSTLYLLDKKVYKSWARAVRSQVPKWRMLGVINPRIGSMNLSETDICFSYIILMGTIGMILYQFLGLTGIVYSVVIAVLGIVGYILYRKLSKEIPSEPISTDAFQEESCKALQVVLEAARKECTEKFKVFVIGIYEQLTYSGDSIETSNGHTVHEAFFEPRE
jgi:hypothetical protein